VTSRSATMDLVSRLLVSGRDLHVRMGGGGCRYKVVWCWRSLVGLYGEPHRTAPYRPQPVAGLIKFILFGNLPVGRSSCWALPVSSTPKEPHHQARESSNCSRLLAPNRNGDSTGSVI